MTVKATLVFCASALLLQSAYSACIGGISTPYNFAGTGCGYNGLAAPGLAYDSFTAAPGFAYEGIAAPALVYERAGLGFGYGVASTGGGLPCASASANRPVGVSVVSENAYEGTLAAGGKLPFLGTVGIEGVLPTAGAGAVSYGCGNSLCAVGVEEGGIATGIAPHAPGPYGLYGAYGSSSAAAAYNGFNGIGKGFGPYGSGFGCGVMV